MKKTLSVICILSAMLSSCNEQEKSKSSENTSPVGSILSLQTIDQQMEACSASVSAYNNLIDQVLGGDFEAVKKLDVAKDLAVTKLGDLKKLATRFNLKQSEAFAAVQKKFAQVNGRIR